MCCSAWFASFSNTITGTWEVLVDGKINHVLWYQNRVGDRSPEDLERSFTSIIHTAIFGTANWEELYAARYESLFKKEYVEAEIQWRRDHNDDRKLSHYTQHEPPRGNCLIIPLQGSWESIRLLNTIDVPSALTDISEAVAPLRSRDTWSLPVAGAGGFGESFGVVFLKFDIYDIVLAKDANSIAAVLPQIDVDKRPEVNPEVFSVLADWYDCPVDLCCFKDKEYGEAKPLAFAFEPRFPHQLSVYTLDGHAGHAPVPNAMVNLDHSIFVGSYANKGAGGVRVRYTDGIPDHLRPYMLDYLMGVRIHAPMENGDIVFPTDAVRAGEFKGLRSLPPGAPSGLPRLGQKVMRHEGYN